MNLNHAERRHIHKAIGKTARVLCGAVAERSNGVVSVQDLEAAHFFDERREAEKVDGLRQWIAEFDAGLIVPDGEEDV